MKILLVYATYSSGTATVSTIIEDILKNRGHEVKRQTAKVTNPEDFNGYDLIILGSPSWQGGEGDKKDGQPHIHFAELMQKFQQGIAFDKKSFAIYGLGDAHYARFCGAVDILEEWVKNLKGALITQSLRINKYPFDEDKNNQLIHTWTNGLSDTIS